MGCKGSRVRIPPPRPIKLNRPRPVFLFASVAGVRRYAMLISPLPPVCGAPCRPSQPLAANRTESRCASWSATTTVTSPPASRRSPRRSARSRQVTVVAPERDRSGASNSLTLDRPALASQDVQRLSITSMAPRPTASISRSPGCSTTCPTWSSPASIMAPTWGTTRCIRVRWRPHRGLLLGRALDRGVAGEQVGHDFTAAAHVSRATSPSASCATPFREPVLLNVNVPDVAYERLQGIRVTRWASATRPSRWCKQRDAARRDRLLGGGGRAGRRMPARAPISMRWRTALCR
jgi:hypothetical protein